MLSYLIHSLFDFTQTNIQMHLLLFKLTAFLIEQVGIVVDEVQIVTWSDGHGTATTLCQAIISLMTWRRIKEIKALMHKTFTKTKYMLWHTKDNSVKSNLV